MGKKVIIIPRKKKKPLCSFFDENVAEYMTDQFKLQCLLDCDVVSVFQHIYCNPHHPENQCIKLLSRLPMVFSIHIGSDEWKEIKGDKVMMDIIETCFRYLYNYYVFNKDYVDDIIKEQKRIYPVKPWIEEMNNEDAKLYASIKEAILNALEHLK